MIPSRPAARIYQFSEDAGDDSSHSSRCSFGLPQDPANAEAAECLRARPEAGQTRETLCDTCKSPSLLPMGGPGAPAHRSPPREHSIEEDSGDNRCFPHRLGSSLGRQDGARFMDTPLGWRTQQCSGVENSSLVLKALLSSIQGRHVLIRTDSSSTVYHIHHQGGTKSLRCLQVAQKLLFGAFQHLASLKAIFIPGIVNRAADLLSRTGPPPGEGRLQGRLHPSYGVGLAWLRPTYLHQQRQPTAGCGSLWKAREIL